MTNCLLQHMFLCVFDSALLSNLLSKYRRIQFRKHQEPPPLHLHLLVPYVLIPPHHHSLRSVSKLGRKCFQDGHIFIP